MLKGAGVGENGMEKGKAERGCRKSNSFCHLFSKNPFHRRLQIYLIVAGGMGVRVDLM